MMAALPSVARHDIVTKFIAFKLAQKQSNGQYVSVARTSLWIRLGVFSTPSLILSILQIC
jgi:hypothetical protein